MEPIALHVTMRLVRDQVLAPTPSARRVVARVVLRMCQHVPLLAFACVDTHIHLLLAVGRDEAGRLARRIGISLGRLLDLGSPFDASRHRPVSSVWHLRSSLEYVLMQGRRHGLPWEAYFEASSLPDLLGMRPLGLSLQGAVSRHLPRFQRSEVLSWAGWEGLSPLDGPLDHLVEAALRASALPTLGGGGQELLAARRAILALAGRFTPAEKASLLGVSERSVFRLARRSLDPILLDAVRWQLGWLALVKGAIR